MFNNEENDIDVNQDETSSNEENVAENNETIEEVIKNQE